MRSSRAGASDAASLRESERTAAPEHLQVVDALPRNGQGEMRSEILQLVAMNQVDLLSGRWCSEAERALVGRIVSERRTLRDRFAF